MIHKFVKIENAGIFKDFRWNNDKTQLPDYKKTSIIYGQNYSGKTTLSRIVRAFETKKLPKGFESANFILQLKDKELSNSDITQPESDFTPRVYNEDYIRENITFFGENDTPHSRSFTVIGAKNVTLEQKIRELEKELLKEINCLGIGPAGLGGTTTALAVNINTYPTHIAGLPVAVNICCHVNRHITRTLS